MNKNNKDHRIVAADWQLEAAANNLLNAVILPLQRHTKANLPALELAQGAAAQDGDGNWIIWTPPITKNIKEQTLNLYPKGSNQGIEIDFKEGDRLYLAESWAKEDDLFIAKGPDPNDDERWFGDAEDMPPEAAQWWFKVVAVKLVQMGDLSLGHIKDSCLFHPLVDDISKMSAIAESRWNSANLDYPWSEKRWVIVLELNKADWSGREDGNG